MPTKYRRHLFFQNLRSIQRVPICESFVYDHTCASLDGDSTDAATIPRPIKLGLLSNCRSFKIPFVSIRETRVEFALIDSETGTIVDMYFLSSVNDGIRYCNISPVSLATMNKESEIAIAVIGSRDRLTVRSKIATYDRANNSSFI